MISQDEFVETARQRMQDARDFLRDWYRDARDSYAFIAGNQWSEEDKQILQEQNRPVVVFNYSEKMIDAVCGAEVSGRQEVSYKPRGVEDTPLADVYNAAAEWQRDECDAEDEETDAFRDCLITGVGATRTAMDYDENQDGMIVLGRRDPITCGWDPAARKPGLTDRRYDYEDGWMDQKEAEARWPDATFVGTSINGDDNGIAGSVIRTGHRYEDDMQETQVDVHKDQVQVTLYECMYKEPYYLVADGQQMLTMEEDEFKSLQDGLERFGVKHVKLFRKKYYRGFFSGESLLEWNESPTQVGFTLNFMTGKRDRNRNYWYGLTRVMKDPQRWANKWLSQILHIVNSNAKGGIIAEVDAFVDPKRAQDEWANPDSVTLLNSGALSGNKVKEKGQSQYPQGLDRLMEFALNSLPQVTGINLEALGLANREQANVLEQSRKQAAYGLLAPIFDSLRRYRKAQGRVMLDFINRYIADGRLVRVVGDDKAQYVPLRKMPDNMTCDIIVDQSPNSPDAKAKTWEQLMQLVPVMIKEGLPVPPQLLKYSPLPANLVEMWVNYAQEMDGVNPQQIKQMKDQMNQLMQENQKLKQDQSVKVGELQLKQEIAAADQQLAAQKTAQELALEEFKLKAELQLEEMKLSGEMALNKQRLTHDANMQDAKIKGDLKIKAASAGISQNDTGELALKLDASEISGALESVADSQKLMSDMIQQNNKTLEVLAKAMTAPKTVTRDEQGRPTGVRTVM